LEKGELVLEKLDAPGKEGRCEIRLIDSPVPATANRRGRHFRVRFEPFQWVAAPFPIL
jgi:hypothetical protein